MSDIDARLSALGITLPEPVAPVANYVPFVKSGNQVFISGQISIGPDGLVAGRLGETMNLEEGQAAARLCAINLVAQLKAACGGDLSALRRVVKLGGFVCAAPDFTDIPKVINGGSDLMVEVFGDKGRHARSAVACPVLPLGAAVEIDGVFEVA
ncbi:RidA family protein [Hyphobacterium marinum]|uniref:RidA family protein n=1 Tax=Hyphobacterium marinum TaxID=3116574 RepID=A0ABU7LZ41_9PROT|nr:RidA family protein [Hyphobacterium sp. Y6023]MEE2566831.1 RidA family protein [Hyphobacterium sp. Y6023]